MKLLFSRMLVSWRFFATRSD